MKTIKNRLNTIIILVILILSVSCSDDNNLPQNTHEDAYGDVILKRMEMMGQAKYKLVFFAGGTNVVAAESTVTLPYNITINGNETNQVSLEEFWAGAGKLRNMAAPMMNSKPAAGDFTFNLKFSDGYEKTVVDTLEDIVLPNTPNVVVDYTPGDTSMVVSWSEVPGADFYCLKITDLDILADKPLFKKPQIETSQTSFTVNIDGGNGWMRPLSDLVSGTGYWVTVSAKKVETGKPVSGMSNDFQTNACSKVQITY